MNNFIINIVQGQVKGKNRFVTVILLTCLKVSRCCTPFDLCNLRINGSDHIRGNMLFRWLLYRCNWCRNFRINNQFLKSQRWSIIEGILTCLPLLVLRFMLCYYLLPHVLHLLSVISVQIQIIFWMQPTTVRDWMSNYLTMGAEVMEPLILHLNREIKIFPFHHDLIKQTMRKVYTHHHRV